MAFLLFSLFSLADRSVADAVAVPGTDPRDRSNRGGLKPDRCSYAIQHVLPSSCFLVLSVCSLVLSVLLPPQRCGKPNVCVVMSYNSPFPIPLWILPPDSLVSSVFSPLFLFLAFLTHASSSESGSLGSPIWSNFSASFFFFHLFWFFL